MTMGSLENICFFRSLHGAVETRSSGCPRRIDKHVKNGDGLNYA